MDIERLGEHRRFIREVISPRLKNELVINAFTAVDRAAFAPQERVNEAYQDRVLPISERSSISQPSLVATMIELLRLTGSERVMEVGTASGYEAAVLSKCCSEVDTVESDAVLAEAARDRLKHYGFVNVTVHIGDGALGLPESGLFDAIIISAGVRGIPPALTVQLKEGGRIVYPRGNDPEHLHLTIGMKYQDKIFTETLEECGFFPLVSSEEGCWTEAMLVHIREVRLKVLREMEKLSADLSEDEMLAILRQKYQLAETDNINSLLSLIEVDESLYLEDNP